MEFLTPGEIRAAHGVHREIVGGGWLRLRAGAVTDDTEMSLCLARAADAAGGWSARAAAEALAAEIARFPQVCLRGDRMSAIEQWDLSYDAAMANEFAHGRLSLAAGAAEGAARFAGGKGRGGRFDEI